MNSLKKIVAWIFGDPTENLARTAEDTAGPKDWRQANDPRDLGWAILIVIGIFALSMAGCETVGSAFKSATGSCVTVENLTSSEYVVVSSLGNGSRKEIRYGESKTHNVYLSGDQDEVDMTIAILRGGETLATESDEVWFQDDKSGCELKTVSLENQGGFDIDL
jgi:hypothetical protein